MAIGTCQGPSVPLYLEVPIVKVSQQLSVLKEVDDTVMSWLAMIVQSSLLP
jgi:hypothetical protein